MLMGTYPDFTPRCITITTKNNFKESIFFTFFAADLTQWLIFRAWYIQVHSFKYYSVKESSKMCI